MTLGFPAKERDMGIRNMLSQMTNLSADDVLHLARLERRRSGLARFGAVTGMLGLGLLVGAGLGLLLAPTSGREARRAVSGRVGDLRHRAMEKVRRGESNGGALAS